MTKSELHSKIRDINVSHGLLVVGSTLEALLYSYLNNVPIISSTLNPPLHFEHFSGTQDLSALELDNQSNLLTTNRGQEKVGMNKLWLWERLFFSLSLSGLYSTTDRTTSIRLSDGILKATTPNARMVKISYENLIIFDSSNIVGVGYGKPESETCTVYDWFSVRSGMKHEYDIIYDDSNFVEKIIFYPSDRVAGEHDFKDAVSVSTLSKSDIDCFDYSDVNARFKTKYMMKQVGIRGARNGRDVNDKTKYKYYDVKIENTKRQVIPAKTIHQSEDNIVFNYDSFDDIMSKNRLKPSYVSSLFQRSCKP